MNKTSEERMGELGEEGLFPNFILSECPGAKIVYHSKKYASFWDVKVIYRNTTFFYQIKTGAPFVTQEAGVLSLDQREKYLTFMYNPTIDEGLPNSKLTLLYFPCEGLSQYNKEIREKWLGSVYALRQSVITNTPTLGFRIQDDGRGKRYIIPIEENYRRVAENLHKRPENKEIYEEMKSLNSGKYK